MAGLGIGNFLGGVVDQRNALTELGLRERGLGIQERTLLLQQEQEQRQARQAAIDLAGKEIDKTMTFLSDRIKEAADNPNFNVNINDYAEVIAGLESAGMGDYGAIGKETDKGDRAYGRYGVMGNNVGPWTEEVLGKALSPAEFLANPDAQDAVFKAKFSQLIDKYGNADDAASAWHSGRPLAEAVAAGAKDVLGTTTGQYVTKFSEAVAKRPGQKMAALVTPGAKDIAMLAEKSGRDPQTYLNQIQAQLQSTAFGFAKAKAAGENAALQRIAEYQSYARTGLMSEKQARATAGIQEGPEGKDTTPTPYQQSQMTATLRDDYQRAAKPFLDVREAYNAMLQTPDTSAGNMALIYQYLKLLDPTSVARESEQLTVETARGVDQAFRDWYNQIVLRKKLTPDQRRDIVNTARNIYEGKKSTYESTVLPHYKGIAERQKLDPRDVIMEFKEPKAPDDLIGGDPELKALLQKYSTTGGAVAPVGASPF